MYEDEYETLKQPTVLASVKKDTPFAEPAVDISNRP